MKKQNLLLLAGVGAVGYMMWKKNQQKSTGVTGIAGTSKNFSLYREEHGNYIFEYNVFATSWKNALKQFKTSHNLSHLAKSGAKYVIIEENKVHRLSMTDIMYR